MSGGRKDFIRSHTALTAPPACPEIRLYLASEVTPLWLATEDFLAGHNLPPPYWAFAWVGGQGLTRYLLDTPLLAAGKHVLDFASGSGLGAIAAAKCGAARSEAAEIDAMAAAAIALNAEANGVAVEIHVEDVLARDTCRWDLVMAGDVCYEKAMAERVFAWLRRCAQQGATVLLADPGRAYLPKTGLLRLASYVIDCSLDLEDRPRREVHIYKIIG